jgi:hypothetical protein
MALIELLDPTSATRVKERPLAERHGSLAGKRIGFLSNRKANAGLLLDEIEQQLRSQLGDFTSVRSEKGAAEPAPRDVLERLLRCDAVVTAIAD